MFISVRPSVSQTDITSALAFNDSCGSITAVCVLGVIGQANWSLTSIS